MTDLFFNVNRMNTAIDIARTTLDTVFQKKINPVIGFLNYYGYSYDHTTVLILTELIGRQKYSVEKLCELFGAENVSDAMVVDKVLRGSLDNNVISDVARRVLVCITQQQLTQQLLCQQDCFIQSYWLTKDECLTLIAYLDKGG